MIKKLLGIIVLGLLLSGNAFAEIIKFDKCWPTLQGVNSYTEFKKESDHDEWYWEIDLKKNKATRVAILNDKTIKHYIAMGTKNVEKYSIDTFKINSSSSIFIKVIDTTDFGKDTNKKYTFNLKKAEINSSNKFNDLNKSQCTIYRN